MKNYVLKLADDSFIMAQRLIEWCGLGPYLEEDIALTNIALDQLGQANNLYELAAKLDDDKKSADDIAFLRYEHEYLNAHWVELPNEDYAQTMLKVYVMAVYQKHLYEALANSEDPDLSAIAKKSIKEVNYHYLHASTWMKVFAGGTEESKQRLNGAIERIWEYTKGIFASVEGEDKMMDLKVAASGEELYKEFQKTIKADFEKFGIDYPSEEFMQKRSRTGYHTEYFGYILCELQFMQRAYPGCTW